MRRFFLEEINSTNTFLKDVCRQNSEHGAMAYSFNQTSGYGRRGKFWHSEKDAGIALSIALKCPPNAESQPFSIVAGVAVYSALAQVAPDVAIKWPNDILANGRKLCGISCERIFAADIAFYVVGVGVNVNNTSFPGDLADTATSLLQHTGQIWDLQMLTDKIAACLFQYYDLACGGGFSQILSKFRQYCQNIRQFVTILYENRQISGTVVGIEDDGRIVLQLNNGKCEKFSSGEVSLRAADQNNL